MATKSKAIETIVQSSQGAKVKTVSANPSLTSTEILDLIHDSAKQVIAYKQAGDSQISALETLNKKITCLHNGGVRFEDGRSGDKATKAARTAFKDSLGDLSATYKQDIWELFRSGVNSGKELKTLNKSRNKGKKGGDKGEPEFDTVIAKVYNHSEFKTLSTATKKELKDILAKAGYEFKE